MDIDISWNYKLTGSIPEAFGLLENLTFLSFSSNNISGEIPAFIARLPSLWDLDLTSNRFTGTLQADLGKHSDLRFVEKGCAPKATSFGLIPDNNHFNGSISLANNATLHILCLNNNQLRGAVPERLCARGHFRFLIADNNLLNGSIPSDLANYGTLERLSLNNNQLTGTIGSYFTAEQHSRHSSFPNKPSTLPRGHASAPPPPQAAAGEAALLLKIKSSWGDPPALAGWNASAAGAHCDWPYVWCDTEGRVVSLTLIGAGVAGPFLDAIGDLSALTSLDLSNNNISGAFPTALYRRASIEYLGLSHNNLTGELPSDMGLSLGESLIALFLDHNLFSCTIPLSLGSLKRLEMLWLSNNPFDAGELPA
ncbi:hypothetical protein U9M48_005668 [Paspalum notatum var. saurae]|uniref:Leucine-rich repeat-containing N-terminal plant-type domain-containing protein n=1 Tax=Paspalum notatum var. saurae TaxID=547442 RepID=A0AAQ3PQM0_PASNO